MKSDNKKAFYVKVCVVITAILFILLLFSGMPTKAMAILLLAGGVLGLITKTNPFTRPPQSPRTNFRISYDDDSILGPLINIGTIFLGLMLLSI